MALEYIRNFSGQILGTIETKPNGDQVARAFPSQKILGFYRKQYDHTTDFSYRILARGNVLSGLIYNNHE